jgi:alkylation response protein AidB-like acyl-CoA dehydrogenase
VWTTNGQHAQLGYLLARTNPDVPKRAGITAFVLDMTSPGVDVRPLREITGTSDFNEVFFDGVRIPKDNVLGVVDDGWKVATTSLAEERSSVGTAGIVMLRAVRDAVAMARSLRRGSRAALDNDAVRQDIGRLHATARVNVRLGQSPRHHRRRLVARRLPVFAGPDDRRRRQRGIAQHHRRAVARIAQGAARFLTPSADHRVPGFPSTNNALKGKPWISP